MILRGDVYWVDFDKVFPRLYDEGKDHYMRGIRPCVVISNNFNNRNNSIVNIMPLTTSCDNLPQHRYLPINGITNYTVPECVTSIDKSLLRGKYGMVSGKYYNQIEKAIDIQLGLYGNRHNCRGGKIR